MQAATTLQEFCTSSSSETRDLGWRRAAAGSAPCSDCDDDFPKLRPGETLRLDTFLNCFYERYWCALTPLRSFGVEIVASGSCTIRLARSGRGRPRETIQEAASSGTRTVTSLTVPSDPDGAGVLHVEVQAGPDPVQVHAGRWTTAEPPANPVALLIVICSFGREDMVAATLAGMSEIVANSAAIRRVLVVHQGPDDLAGHAAIRDLIAADQLGGKMQIVRQANLGGSGGFARGMIEALALGVTDVLLMDDDIRLEPSVLSRLTSLLAYLAAPTTLGGQMLHLRDPTRLYASHERVDLGRTRLVNPYKNVDLGASEPACLFQDVRTCGYCAWWFCCIPIEVIRNVGLPLPIFIRHDDVEHGVRTIRAGRPLVTVPGLFVWHEAFEAKAKPWQVYYDRRNFLVCAALHGWGSAFRRASLFAREAWAGLALGRYDYCWAVCRAATDYLEGPAVVFSDSAPLHQAILAETGRHMLQSLQALRRRRASESPRADVAPVWSRMPPTLAILISLTRRDASASFRRRLALSIVAMTIRLWLEGSRVARVYRASARHYTTPAFWEDRIGLPSRLPLT